MSNFTFRGKLVLTGASRVGTVCNGVLQQGNMTFTEKAEIVAALGSEMDVKECKCEVKVGDKVYKPNGASFRLMRDGRVFINGKEQKQ